MHGDLGLERQGVGRWDTLGRRPTLFSERRRTERIPVRLAFDVYDRGRYLGRFWTRDVSPEGLFLHTEAPESLRRTILSLRFCADGVQRCLRGTAVHAIPGEGVGVQIAVWRQAGRADHYAYHQLIDTHGQAPRINAA
ncbi:MAG: PilZ domain-containing protein [Bdellovibrio bacteriovorus]